MERKLKKENTNKKISTSNLKSFELNGLPSGWKLEEAQFEEQKQIDKMFDNFVRGKK